MNRRHNLYDSGQLRPRASRRAENEARTMSEWKRLANRNPRAVPHAVQRTLVNRGYFSASYFKGV